MHCTSPWTKQERRRGLCTRIRYRTRTLGERSIHQSNAMPPDRHPG